MFATKALVVFLLIIFITKALACSEDSEYYTENPLCKPSNFNEGISCEKLGNSVNISGGVYTRWELHFNPLASDYYMARMADALGLAEQCPTNRSMLAELDLITPWSGVHGGIAIDGAFGYDRNILRRCTFPTEAFPFICLGSAGTPGTFGERLGAISYISLLNDDVNHKWTLFGQCWNAKTPENPNAKPIATSWNVFSLDQTLPRGDKARILAKVKQIGFDTSKFRRIEPNYN